MYNGKTEAIHVGKTRKNLGQTSLSWPRSWLKKPCLNLKSFKWYDRGVFKSFWLRIFFSWPLSKRLARGKSLWKS